MSGSVLELAGSVASQVFRSFVKAIAGMLVLAIVLACVTFAIASKVSLLAGVVIAITAVIATMAGSLMISVKRAALDGLARGLEQKHLGQQAALLVLSPDGPLGRSAERVPLAEAQRRLRSAVASILGQRAQQYGFRALVARVIQNQLFWGIEQVTLARFRADAAEHGGGVDLAKVGAELGERADRLLSDLLRRYANRLTVIMVLIPSALTVGLAYGIRYMAQALRS